MKKHKRFPAWDIYGEPEEYNNSETRVLHLTCSEAQRLVDMIVKHDKLSYHYVKYSKRRTKKIMATYDPMLEKITVYSGNGSVHTILHEMAHHVTNEHDNVFKKCFKRYMKLWNKKWRREFV